MSEHKMFSALNVSSKFAICGLPLRVDTYKTCGFQCAYCFSNCRKVMEFEKTLQVANIKQLEKKLLYIYIYKRVNEKSFLDMLLANRITWHCGGMSDPFQPIEEKLQITKQMIDVANKYNVHILFSTKSATTYDCDIRPELHTFQLSITNVNNDKRIEPNVPSIEERYKFFRSLKDRGFKVGIRIQPFIPNITTLEIIEKFKDADFFTLEGLKIVPQNKEHKEFMLKITGLDSKDFIQMGLLNLRPTIRLKLYEPFINKLEEYHIPYSIADNDLHYLSKSKCCCGDVLINKSTDFNTTAMFQTHGQNYSLKDVKEKIGCYGECCVNHLFTSNRQEGCKTINEFYDKRFYRKTSPFSPHFSFHKEDAYEQMSIFGDDKDGTG